MANKKETKKAAPKKTTKKIELDDIKKVEFEEEKSVVYGKSIPNSGKIDLEDDKKGLNRINIICAIVGLVIGILVMGICYPERIATTSDGAEVILEVSGKNITANDLYTKLKENSGLTVLLQEVDKTILDKKYDLNKDQQKEVESQADNYIQMYSQYYGYTESEFLTSNGFKTKDDFIDYLAYQYKTNLYYQDYLASLVTDEEIEKYYKDSVVGDIETKYIAVTKLEDESENKKAKALAEEILKKINKGSSYDEIVKEYKGKILSADLKSIAWNNEEVDETYHKTLNELKKNTNSKVVETSFGYTIIFRGESKDKAKLKEVKDDILEVLKVQKDSEEENLYYKAFVELRKENKLKFYDTDMEKQYKDYVNQYK